MFADNRYSFRTHPSAKKPFLKVFLGFFLFLCIGLCAFFQAYSYYWENFYLPDPNNFWEVGEHFAMAMKVNNGKKAKLLSSEIVWKDIDQWITHRSPINCHDSIIDQLDGPTWIGGGSSYHDEEINAHIFYKSFCWKPNYRFTISIELEETDIGWVISNIEEVCDIYKGQESCQ